MTYWRDRLEANEDMPSIGGYHRLAVDAITALEAESSPREALDVRRLTRALEAASVRLNRSFGYGYVPRGWEMVAKITAEEYLTASEPQP